MLVGLDNLPHALNMWRHALSWLGGMGIIVLAVAILPLLGVGGMQLYRAGAPGFVKDAKLAPRITGTAKTLGVVYGGLTLVCALSLWIAGMSLFDAICHAFSTLALGGFSTHDANIGYFHSPVIELVLMFFMLVAALNFATHFTALRRGDFDAYRRDPEARWMLALIFASVIAISVFVNFNHIYSTPVGSLRYAAFNVISMATDSGYFNTNYGDWPIFAPLWMLFLSCYCSCTGSTGGGIRMFRSLILVKQSLRELFTLVSGEMVPNGVVYSVLAFIFLYFMTIAALTFVLLITGMDFMSGLSAIIACINNAGPGLNLVGPTSNYSQLTGFQSWVCIAAMFLGRVQIITVAVLLTPTFWRK